MLEVVAGIITINSNFLCFQKGLSKYDYLTNKYEFPGGKIEPGESKESALIRELNEELKINITSSDLKFFCETTYSYPDFSVILFSFFVSLDKIDYQLTEHQNCKWCSLQELKNLDWADADKEIVNNIIRYYE